MRLHADDRYDAEPAEVYAMFCDPDFIRAKYDTLGYPKHELVRLDTSDDGATVSTRRWVPANVPGFAKKLFGETTEMVQTDIYGPETDGVRHGTWTIEVPGKPVKASGSITLAATAEGSLVTIDGELKASIPLIGGKIESWAGGEAAKTLRDEHEFAVTWLEKRSS
jgi:hypothetical protein